MKKQLCPTPPNHIYYQYSWVFMNDKPDTLLSPLAKPPDTRQISI